ncbi:glycerol-3-phosphate responsive antiterminator [Bengtsoniella intestinalis]|uniref:glycerol-3-phosphate responsive antiterminator n=1 Tax=Bengtsoniella intestinalis TaxID=3073143 RepID=UPI00391F50E0
MKHRLYRRIEDCPVIAAVKDDHGLTRALTHEGGVIFVLYGDLISIGGIVEKIHGAGKIAVVHVDLITGLGNKEVAVDFIHSVKADGILTTKPQLIRRGKELGMLSILRFFVFDSMALQNVEKSTQQAKPDLVEILPGIMPKVIKRISQTIHTPIIVGGLIADKEDVMEAMKANAVAASTSNEDLWDL